MLNNPSFREISVNNVTTDSQAVTKEEVVPGIMEAFKLTFIKANNEHGNQDEV